MSASSRREARERAVELLYESESKSVHPSVVIDSLPLPVEDYAATLANGVIDHVDEIDSVLGRYAERWNPKRMAVMDRAVLRMGVYELALEPDVPTGAALNEAVELGTQYGSSDDTGKFVNGILANIAREVRDGGPRPWLPIDAVVFDMDGVIRHWTDERIRELEETTGVSGLDIASIAFTPDLYDAAMTGSLGMAEWAAEIGRRAAESVTGDIPATSIAAAVEQAWHESSWTIDDAVVEIVRGVRAGDATVALFSNASLQLEADLDKIGIADLFDVVCNSSRLGQVKPNVAAFDAAAAEIGVDPGRMLFVDDRPDNVVGAIESGWHAVRMVDATRLRATLERVGVLGT